MFQNGTKKGHSLENEKLRLLGCRREAARSFMSLNVSLNHSRARSLKVIENGAIQKIEYRFLFAFRSNYGAILYHFRDNTWY